MPEEIKAHITGVVFQIPAKPGDALAAGLLGECFRAALLDYEHYLHLRPRAGDAEAVKEKVAELLRLAARLN